jgi:glycerophosphoryl diester phosphodiesterase
VRFLDTPRPRLFAHRGASGLRPENTLDAFGAGLEDGARILELDVHGSSDGYVVVIHDDVLDRTTDGQGPVRARSLAELRRLDAGLQLPRHRR